MIKIWTGKEKEGRCRKKTMFVETLFFGKKCFNIVLELLKKYKISRVYLGAGGKDSFFDLNLVDKISKTCRVIIECSLNHPQIEQISKKKVCLIVKMPTKNLDFNSISVKIENDKECFLFEEKYRTDFKKFELKNGQYKGDVVIYNR